MRTTAPILALTTLLALGACGSRVAETAPALLTVDDIGARADALGGDPARGAQAASDLALRGARLAQRAAALRRMGIADSERRTLLHRADALKRQQD